MGEWKKQTLGDLFLVKNDKTKQLNSTAYQAVGEYPIVDQSINHICGYSDEALKLYNTNLPVTIFGDHTRHVKFIDFPFIAGADGTQLLKPISLDDKYFYYIVLYASGKIGNYGYDRHLKHLKEYKADYSTHKPTQRKIAHILSTADAIIEKTQAAIAKYKAIKQGMLHDLFTRGIDLQTNKLRPTYEDAPELYKESKLGWIPKEWEVIKIENFASDEKNAIVDGPFGSNLKTIHYRTIGVPIIQSGFVTSNDFRAEKYLYVDNEKFQSEIRSKTLPGDIIMAKIGAQCGKCAILPENHPVGILAGNCLKITVEKKNSNIFLMSYLHFLYETGLIDKIISTTAQPAVSMSSLKIMSVIYPDPIEQKRIADKLEIIKNKIQTEQTYQHKLHQIKAGLMADLLSGKKRVNVEKDT